MTLVLAVACLLISILSLSWPAVAANEPATPGTLQAWGYNSSGELGDGANTQSNLPVQVKDPGGTGLLNGVVAFSAGGAHSLALKNDGTVWAWGYNIYGQLGDGTNTSSNLPVQVRGSGGTGFLNGVVAISACKYHSLALMNDGTVQSWGYNYYGQLGDGTNTSSNFPVQVKDPGGTGSLTGIVDISGENHGIYSIALKDDGTVWAWGYNWLGQLGDGTYSDRNLPVQVKGPGGTGFLTGVVEARAGDNHSLALLTDGTVRAWGDNYYGQLGDGTYPYSNTPIQVVGEGGTGFLAGVAAVEGGGGQSLALLTDGTVRAWGYNWAGQLGDGTTDNRNLPVQVKATGGIGSLTGVAEVYAGGDHSVALMNDGTVRTWGSNHEGQLGDGTDTDSSTPIQVVGPGGTGFLSGVAAVSAGDYHNIALMSAIVTTQAADNITTTGARLNGRITETGGEDADQRGFSYRKEGAGSWSEVTQSSGPYGTGDFSETLSGLDPGTTYEFYAWSHNSSGRVPVQPAPLNFTTLSPPPPPATAALYLAEGTNAWGFSTYITLANPNDSSVHAKLTYMDPNGQAASGKGVLNSRIIVLPALSQTTVSSMEDIGAVDFSTRVECTEGKTIAVDRTMFWTGEGTNLRGYHSSVASDTLSKTWYLPEGSSAWGFETWTCVLNPNATPAKVTLTYMTEAGPKTAEKTIPPDSRATYPMASDVGNVDASIQVSSDVPVMAERSIYRNNRREGSCSLGATAPAADFYLAEGATGYAAGFTTYILVQNPGTETNKVTLTFNTEDGAVAGPSFEMAPGTRKTVKVNDSLPANTDVSTTVHGTKPLVAERAMYWDAGLGECFHASIGLAQPHMIFMLPDGQADSNAQTYTLVANPNPGAVTVRITYLKAAGGAPVSFTVEIPKESRATFNMVDKVKDGRASILVESLDGARPVMVERAMYGADWGSGTDTIGASSD